MSKTVLSICIVACLLQSCQVGYTLQSRWPKRRTWHDERNYDSKPVKKGYVVAANHDSIAGLVKLLHPWAVPILPEGKNNEKDLVKFKLEDIKTIGVFDDTLTNKQTTYVNINYKSTLWRLVAKKGNIGIYDNYYPATNYDAYCGKTILVNGTEKIKLFTWLGYVLRLGNTKPLLLKFITSRYGTVFNKEDFKSKEEIFTYIISKENEKVQSKSTTISSGKSNHDFKQ